MLKPQALSFLAPFGGRGGRGGSVSRAFSLARYLSSANSIRVSAVRNGRDDDSDLLVLNQVQHPVLASPG
jgi:hypothetical protein